MKAWIHRLAGERPWTVIAVWLGLALVGGWIYATRLEVVADRRALTRRDTPFARQAEAFERAFGTSDAPLVLVVAAEGEGRASREAREAMKGVADAWTEALGAQPELFPMVRARVPFRELGEFGLLYLPDSAFTEVVSGLGRGWDDLEGALRSRSLAELVELAREGFEGAAGEAADGGDADRSLAALLRGAEQALVWLDGALVDGPGAPPPDLESALLRVAADAATGDADPEGYFFTGDGRLLTAVAAVREDASGRATEAVDSARAALARALLTVPEGVAVTAGVSGPPALEVDEMRTSRADSARAALWAALAVSLLFMWAFRSILRPALATLCLGVSVATTFIVAWAVFGRLNVLAMVFVVVLVALGVDFAIHFYT
ncbi:MAG: hypothetical protein D6701_12615, partial [Gemmatimonadetes bacterium]